MNINIREKGVLHSYSLSRDLKALIHGGVVEYQVGCTELTVVVWANWRPQQPIQVHGVD